MNFTVYYGNVFSLDYSWACLMACVLSLERNREDWRDIYTKTTYKSFLVLCICQVVFSFAGVISLGVQSCVLHHPLAVYLGRLRRRVLD